MFLKLTVLIVIVFLLGGCSNLQECYLRGPGDLPTASTCVYKKIAENSKGFLSNIEFFDASDDKETMRVYSRTEKYIFQGAISGIITAAGGNCIANILSDNKCLNNAGIAAAVGGGLGAAGGWIVASQQRDLEGQSVTLDQKLNSARLELDQAKRNRKAAKHLADEQISEIKALRHKSYKSKEDEEELKQKLMDVEETIIVMNASDKRMESEISALRDTIKNEKDSRAKKELKSILKSLTTEKNLLQNEIDRLNTV